MKKSLYLLVAVFSGAAFAGGEVNQGAATDVVAVKFSKAVQVIDRAMQAAAQTREYSAEVEKRYLTRNDNAVAVPRRSKESYSFRAPACLWAFSDSGGTDRDSVKLADGQSHYTFKGSQPQTITKMAAGTISGATFDAYPNVHLSLLSPLTMQVYSVAAYRADKAVAMTYGGRELIGGVLCDRVEFTVPVLPQIWQEARKANAALPGKPGDSVHTYYFGTEDGLLRRQLVATEIPGVSQEWSEEQYTVRKVDPTEQFTLARLEAAVKLMVVGGSFPVIKDSFSANGQPLPALAATVEDGHKLDWKDYHGKVLVVETWATWCRFCKEAMPFYERMRQELSGKGVVFMALNFEKDKALYEKWVKDNRSKYDFLYARADVTDENWNAELTKFKGGLPSFYVVGRDGNVVSGYGGFGYGWGNEDPRLLVALAKAGVDR